MAVKEAREKWSTHNRGEEVELRVKSESVAKVMFKGSRVAIPIRAEVQLMIDGIPRATVRARVGRNGRVILKLVKL